MNFNEIRDIHEEVVKNKCHFFLFDPTIENI